MNTETLKTEMEKKRLEVIEAVKKNQNKDIVKATGLSPGYISNVKCGNNRLKSYESLLNIAEKLGL